MHRSALEHEEHFLANVAIETLASKRDLNDMIGEKSFYLMRNSIVHIFRGRGTIMGIIQQDGA